MATYSNSPLVSYTKLSPNNSGQRNHSIDRITPHCYVGQVSVERMGYGFGNPAARTSCNYGIGEDGRIALICEEKNRSWCSSSAENDHRAITIECASDADGEPYAFKNVVYERLIDLCVDICKRNGKKKLLWLGSKEKTLAYTPKADEMVLSAHRWFAAKSCPGNWMYSRMGDLASKVTARLGKPAVKPQKPATTNESVPTRVWRYLKEYGFSDYAVAGIMANLLAKSVMFPNNVEDIKAIRMGVEDYVYTKNVDNGTYTDFATDGVGYGLNQWHTVKEKTGLLAHAKWMHVSIADVEMQIDYLVKSIKANKTAYKAICNAKTASDAAVAFFSKFDGSTNQKARSQRAGFAESYYKRYKGTVPDADISEPVVTTYPATPFTIEVKRTVAYHSKASMASSVRGKADPGVYTITEVNGDWGHLKSGAGWINLASGDVTIKGSVAPVDVNYLIKTGSVAIRSGCGSNYKYVGLIAPGVYTIVKEGTGKGAKKWGLLKSGIGWISLDNVKKL